MMVNFELPKWAGTFFRKWSRSWYNENIIFKTVGDVQYKMVYEVGEYTLFGNGRVLSSSSNLEDVKIFIRENYPYLEGN